MSKAYSRILAISDQHFPYEHPDIIQFLRALNKKYKPDLVINLGDEIDGAAIKFHEISPDMMGPSDELNAAKRKLKELYKLFPKMMIVESNHGSLFYRRASFAGLPKQVIKNYNDILEAPKGWKWFKDLTIKMSNGAYLYVCHGRASDGLKLSQSMGMSCLQGHHHEKFEIRYWGNSQGLFWSCIAGCLLDNDSLAFGYNKLNLKRPIIGTCVIIDGIPRLEPMVLNKGGRWCGKLA
jgi:hypothetical protein